METETQPGSESLSIEQAAAAFTKAKAEAVQTDDAEVEDDESGTTTDDELQASDEDVSDEADGETASEDDAAESEDDEPETERGRFVADDAKVRLADGTVTTVHELKRGNLREADYTRKTQEAAALHTETAAQRQRLEASQKQTDEMRDYMVALIQSIVPQAPDPELLQSDPMAYMRQEAQRKQWGEHLNYLQSEQQRMAQERRAKATEDEKGRLDKEWTALLGKMPELKDEKRLDSFVADLKKFGAGWGLTPDDLAAFPRNHVYSVIAAKAIKWDKLQASKAQVEKKVEGKPPVQKGGKRLNASDRKAGAAADALARLKQSGSVEDATRAYLASLNQG